MEKLQTLADLLDSEPVGRPPETEVRMGPPEPPDLEDITDSVKFSQAVLESHLFRRYIVNGLVLGDIPSAIITRLMDHGWGVPVKKMELTGKDGKPIETVTEVRRVIVRAAAEESTKPIKHAVH